ncbi:microtubule associated protein-domain-containing protein [Absidia repens]|uniref:Microtubule associated protein-domain-containing protein n=1 Tax=Absidia repens TaxID=90262 RepID=A0A1X2I739_9FUNG|nr:microtubule associated protein-domain-containing protein [Absidia repens]
MTREELMDHLGSRFETWTLLHEELGTPSTKQQENRDQLCRSMLNLIDNHITTLTNERDALQQQCKQTYKAIVKLKRLMGEYIDDSWQDHQQRPYSTTLDKLNAEKDIVQKHYEKRLADVKELYQRLEEYQTTLDAFVNTELIIRTNVDVSLPTVTALEEEIRRCENEYVQRAQQVDSGAELIRKLWEDLDVSPKSSLDHSLNQLHENRHEPDKRVSLYATLVQDHQLDNIMQTIAQLEELKQQREFRKQEISQLLYRLWDRLQVENDEKNIFLQSNKGVSTTELQKYEMELDRMLKLKSEKVQDFILDARNEIEGLWNQLYFSQRERDGFAYIESDDYNDNLLEEHENEVERLKHMVEDRKYILDKVERHMKLLQEIQDFKASTNDPKRLFGKGQRDPGRLLREEKFRKRISRELPKSKRELEGALYEFQDTTGFPFTVYGECYLDQLTADTKQSGQNSEAHLTTTPKRFTRAVRPPMTSPRHRSQHHLQFRTPQHNRIYNKFQNSITETKNEWRRLDYQVSSTTSALHRTREKNIRKRQSRIPQSNINNVIKDIKNTLPASDEKQRQTRRNSDSTCNSDSHTLVEKDYIKNENTAPPDHTLRMTAFTQKKQKSQTLSERRALFFEDDDMTLDLGIFDDGPELSDMSDN